MEYFVQKGSIVRKIWGQSDIILFIFAGASAEFALNKAVDWLYFTGKLPSDPLGRLFSTVGYAREIVFSTQEDAHSAIDKIKSIHRAVEKDRGGKIPDWAYRDVLFMLIYYSKAAFELLERKINPQEKEELYQVFYRVGDRMGLKELPEDYVEWLPVRQSHLEQDLEKSSYSLDLFKQYGKHLGAFRYRMLIEAQKLILPSQVISLLGFSQTKWLLPAVPFYKLSKKLRLDGIIKNVLLPVDYKAQIKGLDVHPF
jgi:hypothetical protein